MCHNFLHDCSDNLVKKIQVVGGESYFLICAGNHNYLYKNDTELLKRIRGLLFLEGVALEIMTAPAFVQMINGLPESLKNNVHGNQQLFAQVTQ